MKPVTRQPLSWPIAIPCAPYLILFSTSHTHLFYPYLSPIIQHILQNTTFIHYLLHAIIIARFGKTAKFFIYCTDNDDSCTLYGIHHVLL